MNKKPNGYWTKEKCQEEALKYKSKTDFKKSEKGAYKKATQNKWINDICSHMKSDRKPNGYWTKEKCQEEALKYKTKANFYNQNSSAYSKALKNKWLKNILEKLLQAMKFQTQNLSLLALIKSRNYIMRIILREQHNYK